MMMAHEDDGGKRRARRTIERPQLGALPELQLARMAEAGAEILECYRVLAKTGDNVVGEVLRNQGIFYEWDHYPKGDVYDSETHSQYFYHAHPTELRAGEHGHFHTFLRAKGMPPGVAPAPIERETPWPEGDDALSHLVGISMDPRGFPIRLFTVNRWVTGETWYTADDVCRMLERFAIDHAQPSWPTNRWVTAMLRLFAPEIAALVHARDAAIEAWRARHPGKDTLEERELEITSQIDISVEDQIARVRAALG